MRTTTLLLCFAIFSALPTHLHANGDEVLSKVSVALENKLWDEAVTLFRQATYIDAEKSELFYSNKVKKSCQAAPQMAHTLATYHKEKKNYTKSLSFCKELTQLNPNEVSYRLLLAEIELLLGNSDNALQLYTSVLQQEPSNLSANIFIGNYYYLMAEDKRMEIENKFNRVHSPNKAQYARYKDDLCKVLEEHYSKATFHLEKVLESFTSVEVKRTLDQIKLLEKEIRK